MFAKVKDHENLVRDMNSKAILNTDRLALQEYYQKRELAKKELSEKTESKQRLDKIENDMAEIKELLRMMVSAGSDK
jgi:t-SNARE complex subunit (syntaxin)|tara:strand:- start:473 stop:703 length:231 start_codon:yes stop_codon:yes gene_type:complete